MRDDWQVSGEAVDGSSALQKVAEPSPDAVILDLLMPGMTGFEVAKRIREIAPSTQIIFVSLHNVPIAARESGADAFVSKASSARELLASIDVRSPLARATAAFYDTVVQGQWDGAFPVAPRGAGGHDAKSLIGR